MSENKPNKKLILIVRLILIVWGAMAGWAFARFIFREYPEFLRDGTELVLTVVNSCLFAAVSATLAKPVSTLALSAARAMRKSVADKPLYVTGSVILGVIIGVMLGILSVTIVGVFTKLFVVKFVVAVTVSVAGAYFGFLGCRKCLSTADVAEDDVVIEYSGYILTYGAFFSPKVVYMSQFINGKIYVLNKTLRRLIELSDGEGKAALDNYLKLSEYCSVKVINSASERAENDDIVTLAEGKLLKIVVGTPDELKNAENVKVLSLADL